MEQKVYFSNSKGNKLCGILSNPSGDTTKPIILMVHGFSSSKNSNKFTTLQRVLNEKNISTFRIDFYAHGESEGDFENITISEAVDDILRATEYLKANNYKKIGLIGSSFGGIASMKVASLVKDLYVLGLICPVSDYQEAYEILLGEKGINDWKNNGFRFYKRDNGEKVKVNYTLYKDFKNNIAYNFAAGVLTPTVIIHGDKDEFAPITQSIKTASLIPNCKLKIIKGSDHDFTNPENFKKMIIYISEFIIQHS